MAQSYKEYTGSALTATTFSVPFKYLSINDVNALGFDGTKWNALALHSSTPRDATNKTITLAAAPNTLYTTLRLYRATSTTQLIDFQNGSRLSESDLDAAYQQSLFVAQEIAEDASTTQFTAVAAASLQAGTSLSNFASEELVSDATNGLIDGTNAVFNITAFTPQTTVKEAYRVSIDGVMQSPTDAYSITISPAQITFTSAPPVGSKIVVVTAASAASAVSVDNVTIGLTSANKAEIKDTSVTNAKLAGSITQDKLAGGITNAQLAGSITQDKLTGLSITNSELAGSITQDKLAGSIATSKLAEVIDDDTMTTGVSATSLASSESIKAYVDASSGIQAVQGYGRWAATSNNLSSSGHVSFSADVTYATGGVGSVSGSTITLPAGVYLIGFNITGDLNGAFGGSFAGEIHHNDTSKISFVFPYGGFSSSVTTFTGSIFISSNASQTLRLFLRETGTASLSIGYTNTPALIEATRLV